MIYPSPQTDGTSSFCQIYVKRECYFFTDVSVSVLSASTRVSSGPVALLFFMSFMALLISSMVGLLYLMGRFTVAGCTSGSMW